MQRLGDAVFDGEDAGKKVFWRIRELDATLEDDYHFGGTIREMRAGPEPGRNKGTKTDAILRVILKRLRQQRQQDKEGPAAEWDEEPRVEPPKQGQIRAAMSTGGFPRLESKYTYSGAPTEAQLRELKRRR